jgi:hypothetical protein
VPPGKKEMRCPVPLTAVPLTAVAVPLTAIPPAASYQKPMAPPRVPATRCLLIGACYSGPATRADGGALPRVSRPRISRPLIILRRTRRCSHVSGTAATTPAASGT